MEIQTQIEINASPKVVWEKLTNFYDYDWNPFIKTIEGDVLQGNTIKVELGGMTFKPEVLKFEEHKEFRWKGKLLFKGLFDGEHFFTLKEKTDGSTIFTHGEIFTGVLVALFKKKLLGETKTGFEEMNAALKKECEAV